MWYCEIEFISKSKKTIVFSNEKEAEEFFEYIVNKDLKNLFPVNGMLVNVSNIEIISKPKQYIKK